MWRCGSSAGAVGLMAAATSFARCMRCFSLRSIIREKDARDGGWLNVLDRACECGAPSEDLEAASKDETKRIVAGTDMPLLVVVTYPSQCSFSPCVSPRASTRSPPPGHSVKRRLPCSP